MDTTSTENKIEQIMSVAMDKIKVLADVNTVVGTPFTVLDGTTLIPLSKVTMGFLAGGGETKIEKKAEPPLAGGSGGGISINPIGFLVKQGDDIRIVNIDDASPFGKLFDLLPKIIKDIAH